MSQSLHELQPQHRVSTHSNLPTSPFKANGSCTHLSTKSSLQTSQSLELLKNNKACNVATKSNIIHAWSKIKTSCKLQTKTFLPHNRRLTCYSSSPCFFAPSGPSGHLANEQEEPRTLRLTQQTRKSEAAVGHHELASSNQIRTQGNVSPRYHVL